jgi:hypothetical protein
MTEQQASLSKRVAAACFVSAIPLAIVGAVALLFGRAFAPNLGEVSPEKILDTQAVPYGSYVKFRGLPRTAVSVNSTGKNEGLSVFAQEPRLVMFSKHLDELSREILASSPGSEFYMTPREVAGRLDVPTDFVCPADKLEQFVTKQVGLKSVGEVRILYVGVKQADAQFNALAGLVCAGFFLFIAIFAWGGVIITARRRGKESVRDKAVESH